MKVYLGADHRGFELKNQIMGQLKNRGIDAVDLGAHELLPEDDYNDYAVAVCQAVLSTPDSYGILLCSSAQGMCMQANRFKGIRAAFCHDPAEAKLSREHNDANVICISSDSRNVDSCGEILETFLHTEFLNLDRYIRRNQKLDEALV